MLRGPAFEARWRQPNTLLNYVTDTMPPGDKGGLPVNSYLAIVDHLLGSDTVRFTVAESENKTGGFNQTKRDFSNRVIHRFEPVTVKDLYDPPDSSWLSWRRTLDGRGHSPLAKINRGNVHQLALAWSLSMPEGNNQVTPLVHDGIMFLPNTDNGIQAIEADTGELIWEYGYGYPPGSKTAGGAMRNLAIFGESLYLATFDAALVAIDARTGRQKWRTQKADYREGFTHTSGPIIGGGVILSGISGCEKFGKTLCFITGHDAQTGEELWRTPTIALPGANENASWAGLEPQWRAGGDTWIPGSYDPELNLFYIGTAQAKPWTATGRGMTVGNAALYTNSTLAIDPGTGEIVWYYQHVPGETLDLDSVFERVLISDGDVPALVTTGKDGLLWKLDRRNGNFLGLLETTEQDIYELDKQRGRVRYRKRIREARVGDRFSFCPGTAGGRNWQATAYNPQEKLLYIPMHLMCSKFLLEAVDRSIGILDFGATYSIYPMPGVGNDFAKLVAVDPHTMTMKWEHYQHALFLTGVLSTSGGLIFIGDTDRNFIAFDANSGEVLWKVKLNAALHGYPIAYAVGDDQYVAVPTGNGLFRHLTTSVNSEVYQPPGGHSLFVFRLPKKPATE